MYYLCMKVPAPCTIKPMSTSIMVAFALLICCLPGYAQEGYPDYYDDNAPLRVEESGEMMIEDEAESYYYEDDYFSEEGAYYEEEAAVVEEDSSSVSMLTFNFLFYIVYKLKFEDADSKQETQKTADD